MALVFLTVEEILEIHADQIKRYGGRSGLRDLGLLQSAVAQGKIRKTGIAEFFARHS